MTLAPVIAGCCLLAGSALGQDAVEQDEDGGAQLALRFGQAEIALFATAQLAVEQLSSRYAEQLAATTEQQERAHIIERANGDIVQAVESRGLGFGKYQQMLRAAAQDTELAKQIEEERHLLESGPP